MYVGNLEITQTFECIERQARCQRFNKYGWYEEVTRGRNVKIYNGVFRYAIMTICYVAKLLL